MTRRKLSQRERNRTLLARQLLLQRASLSIPAALELTCGIQNQNAPNAYVRLWSCLADFHRDDLTRAYEAGTVVQGTLMRGTIHTVSADDYHPFVAAIREPLQAWARRIHRDDDSLRGHFVEVVQRRLRRQRPIGRDEFYELLGGASRSIRQTIHTDAEVVRVPPSGTWEQRRAHLFGLADDTIGRHQAVEADVGREHIVTRYLVGFGPAAPADIARFCAIRPAELGPTLERMDLRTYVDENGEELLDIPNGVIADADMPAPVRILPSWDSILLVHARRTAVLAEHHRPRLFHVHVGQSPPTFMVDGTVAGTWHWDAANGRIQLEPFEPLASRALEEVEQEAAGLTALHR